MAKKKNNKKGVKITPIAENVLPQNILPIGERVEENKNIYISQPVYKEIHKFTQNKTVNESGGMLVGSIIEEFGKTNIIVKGFIEAKHCEATPTTLKFTHETWEYVHKEMEKKHPGEKIVGWIHTHPNFGIFLSEYDKFIQENFFKEDYQIAYVVDPIQDIEGFYFWIDGKIERSAGFYIFDKTGAKIDAKKEDDEQKDAIKSSGFDWRNIVIAVLAFCVVLLFFSNSSLNKELKTLQNEQETLIYHLNTINNNCFYLQQEVARLKGSVAALESEMQEEQEPTEQNTTEQETIIEPLEPTKEPSEKEDTTSETGGNTL